MDTIVIILASLTLFGLAASSFALIGQMRKFKAEISDMQMRFAQESSAAAQNSVKLFGDMITQNQQSIGSMQADKLDSMSSSVTARFEQMENRLKTLETTNEQKLDNMRATIEQRLSRIQADNNQRLEEMRATVDEKLQKTLESRMTQSFQLVNDRLEQVYKGLGEMQSLAQGVGDLKKVLSNVKTRGILGEIQLGAILEEILSPEQYDKNVITKPGTKNYVEFAIKLPTESGERIYLPVDSKFPGDSYKNLQDAYDSGSAEAVQAAAAALCARIKQSAKDIRDKYIAPPDTTEFAVMFLPFEGLYAEAVNRGLVSDLQREYRVNIAGPSTMAALLNSLQMGFRAMAIQKRSGEVWKILGAVKTEFDKFGEILSLTQQRIDQANKELDKLIGVRTRSIQRRLRDVEKLNEMIAIQMLDAGAADEPDEDAG
ncbi:MAG: RmuC family protein [Firmicutes bacterium ADurb.Bin182]|nr:MAG: RmuC family protein [Firmicutes bacterium ADurb.Bin182]